MCKGDNYRVIDTITAVVNAGASRISPESALITRNLKDRTNSENSEYRQRGSTKNTNIRTWDRLREY